MKRCIIVLAALFVAGCGTAPGNSWKVRVQTDKQSGDMKSEVSSPITLLGLTAGAYLFYGCYHNSGNDYLGIRFQGGLPVIYYDERHDEHSQLYTKLNFNSTLDKRTPFENVPFYTLTSDPNTLHYGIKTDEGIDTENMQSLLEAIVTNFHLGMYLPVPVWGFKDNLIFNGFYLSGASEPIGTARKTCGLPQI